MCTYIEKLSLCVTLSIFAATHSRTQSFLSHLCVGAESCISKNLSRYIFVAILRGFKQVFSNKTNNRVRCEYKMKILTQPYRCILQTDNLIILYK